MYLYFVNNNSDGSTGGEGGGGDHPVWLRQTGLRRGDDGVKNIRFFGEICCSRTIFRYLLVCSKYKLFSGTK